MFSYRLFEVPGSNSPHAVQGLQIGGTSTYLCRPLDPSSSQADWPRFDAKMRIGTPAIRSDSRALTTPSKAASSSRSDAKADRPARTLARPVVRFPKNNSAGYGPQGLHPDRRGYLARPPPLLKEWCNMGLYARGPRAAGSGYRPALAALRWC